MDVVLTLPAVSRAMSRDIECYEMGLTAPQGEGNGVLWGMVDLFNQTPDVSVNVDEAIVRIAGTKGAVDSASRAIEAVVSDMRARATGGEKTGKLISTKMVEAVGRGRGEERVAAICCATDLLKPL